MEINATQFGLILGTIGSFLLALDILKPKCQELISETFSNFANLKIGYAVLLNGVKDEHEQSIMFTVMTIGALVLSAFILSLDFLGVIDGEWIGHTITIILGFSVCCFSLVLLGNFVQRYNQTIAKILVNIGNRSFFLIFWIVLFISLTLYKLISCPVQYLYRNMSIVKENHLPRFIGLILLFFGFLFQYFGS